MKLTKAERHTAYIIMLAEFRYHVKTNKHNLSGSWFCFLIWDLFGLEDSGFSNAKDWQKIRDVIDNHFPELHRRFRKINPDHHELDLREKILKQCIKETYNF
jgi:hypothetical protein